MEDVPNEDAARLSPLKHANLNTLGRHPRPGLRPLRNPADDDDGED
ncbi:hypothetical protein ACFQVD_32535 [Streptosporangium amethystogenes subsp. fukuiense]|uniref:Tn3 transposase DDE domain-containing protein n=2 Tax=Streptosporangium amethystogenes TaxID=2002 RepID=A0ABW2T826_9ACTN